MGEISSMSRLAPLFLLFNVLFMHSFYCTGLAAQEPAVRPLVNAKPAENTPDNANFEKTALVFPNNRSAVNRAENSTLPSIFSILFYIIIFCSLFMLVMWSVRKYIPGHRQLFAHPAMEVLGRTHLDPRRYVALLRIGKRIIVVGVSPEQLTQLSEITSESEISEIMEVARPKSEQGLNIFQRFFQRYALEAVKDEEAAVNEGKADELAANAAQLKARVKNELSANPRFGNIDINS